ncbi:hypothetical protein HZB60_06400 [candidate division KSB1 bacterium]|nr:hypothetical protein [candidate division KSB1 bacterium]
MKFNIPLFAIVFVALCLCEIAAVRFHASCAGSGDDISEAARVLLREAKLLDYFCFSRLPPVLGAPVVPKEWETALGSEITLTDNAGELAGKHAPILTRLEEIGRLRPGECITVREETPPRTWHAVYKPLSGGTRLLHIAKSDASLAGDRGMSDSMSWPVIIGLAAAGAALITLLNGLLARRSG